MSDTTRTHAQGAHHAEHRLHQDFAFAKPSRNQKMVFLDRAAKRSTAAAEAARKAGYENVRTFGGGVKEYQDNAEKDE